MAGIRPVAIAQGQTTKPVQAWDTGCRRKADRTVRVQRVEVGDSQLFEVITEADADPRIQEIGDEFSTGGSGMNWLSAVSAAIRGPPCMKLLSESL